VAGVDNGPRVANTSSPGLAHYCARQTRQLGKAGAV